MNLLKFLARESGLEPQLQKAEQLAARRRLLLGGGGALAALWAAAARAGTPPQTPEAWLANRITFGATPEEYDRAESLGYEGYLEYHLDYSSIDDSALNTRLAGYTTLTMQPYELIPLPNGQPQSELTDAVILRAIFSKRQLFERMVEFWTDHFNIDITKEIDRKLKTIDDRDVIRANALGNFRTLLDASMHSPAMLFYLDNDVSVAGNPNENYARELMELHTLSVNGGYTQSDVVEVARCLTGWTLWPQNANPQTSRWTYRYNAATHDNGVKTVLGHVIPAGGGANDGVLVRDILVDHPSTAQFISTKLCRRFYGDDPPQSLVDVVADAYVAHNADIREMLRALFLNVDPSTAPLKYKRPFHHFASALRSTAATVNTTNGIRTNLQSAGQVPFTWGPPDGFPDILEDWVGLILPRWSFGASLTSSLSGAAFSDVTFFAGIPNTAMDLADHIDQVFFRGFMPADQKDKIRQYLLPDPPSTTRRKDAVGLAIASPAFQWY